MCLFPLAVFAIIKQQCESESMRLNDCHIENYAKHAIKNVDNVGNTR